MLFQKSFPPFFPQSIDFSILNLLASFFFFLHGGARANASLFVCLWLGSACCLVHRSYHESPLCSRLILFGLFLSRLFWSSSKSFPSHYILPHVKNNLYLSRSEIFFWVVSLPSLEYTWKCQLVLEHHWPVSCHIVEPEAALPPFPCLVTPANSLFFCQVAMGAGQIHCLLENKLPILPS